MDKTKHQKLKKGPDNRRKGTRRPTSRLRLLHEVLEALNDAVFVIGAAEGRILDANNIASEMLGYSHQDLLKLKVSDFNLQLSGPHQWEAYTKSLELAGSRTWESRYRRRDGTTFPVEISVRYLEHARNGYWIAVVRNIAERKTAEEALATAREQLSDILQSLPDPTFVIDRDKKVIAWNHSLEVLTGTSEKEMLGKGELDYAIPFYGRQKRLLIDYLDEMPPEGDPDHKFIRKVDGRVYGETFLAKAYQGKGAHAWGVAVPLYDRSGKRWGAIEVIRDVTERVEAAQQLRKSERMARAVFDYSLDFVGLLSREGIVLDANRTALEFVGCQASDVLGHPFWETPWWSHSQEAQKKLCAAIRAASAGDEDRFETTVRSQAGSIRTIDFSIRPVRDEAGQVVMLIPEGRDVTERKKAEEALAQHAALLEKETEDRREAESRLEAIINSTNDLIWSVDQENRLLVFNNKLKEHFQQNYGKVIETGCCASELLPVQKTNIWPAFYKRVREEGAFRLDYSLPDGRVLELSFSQIKRGSEVVGTAVFGKDITERKQAEKALQRLNRELQAINRCNETLVRARDEQELLNNICRIVCENGGYQMAWVGYAEHDEIKTVRPVAWGGGERGYLATASITWADTERGRGPVGTAIRTGEPVAVQDIETEACVAPWRERALEREYRSICAMPLKDDQGATFGALNIYSAETNVFTLSEIRLLGELAGNLAYGITTLRGQVERRRAEEASRESEGRLRAVFESSRDAIGVSKNGVHVFANPSYLKLFGFEKNEVIVGKNIIDNIAPSHRQKVMQYVRRRFAGEPTDSFYQARGLRVDGTEFDAEFNVTTYTLNGEIYSLATIRDITERKAAEQALRNSEDKFAKAFQASPIVMSLNSLLTGRFIDVNEAFEEVFGYTREEAMGNTSMGLNIWVNPDDRKRLVQLLLANGSLRNEELQFRTKRGEVLTCLHSSELIELGGEPSVLSAIENITERKRVERELERHRYHLEELVKERTSELLQARDAADTANRAKSVFLSNMSHELRTPLNAILGFAQILAREDTLSASQQDNLQIIHKSGEHLLSIINDILDLAKIESGKMRVELCDFDLGDLVGSLIKMLRVRAEEKGLHLIFDQSSSFPRFVRSDSAKIRQIIINLVGNAIKFTALGHISVRLSVQSMAKPDKSGVLLFEITDTGAGIAEADQKRIFQPFEQLAQTDGTGLGLAITQQFVQMLGGAITVESQSGSGSTFRFSIPFQQANDEALAASIPSKGEITAVENAVGTRVLIVEDQADSRKLLKAILSPWGFEVREAGNGLEGVQAFEEWKPHIVFMDRRMPVMTGLEAVRKLRQLPDCAQTPIVAVTAQAFAEERLEMLEAGCNGFLAKPYSQEELFEIIGQHLPVRILYKDRQGDGEAPCFELDAVALRAAPYPLRMKLLEALKKSDMQLIGEIVELISASNPELAEALAWHTGQLAYSRLSQILARTFDAHETT